MADYYSFDRAASNNYFEKVLQINFISNLLKHFFFADLLLIEDFEQCVLQKGADHCSLHGAVSNNYFEKTLN